MECTNCKIHICWKCLKTFKTSTQCYDHLQKDHGGIYDPGYIDEDEDLDVDEDYDDYD